MFIGNRIGIPMTLASRNVASAHTRAVRFDLSWDNAWRESDAAITAGTGNHDALWVFMKYSIDNGTTWKHAMLKAEGGTSTALGNGLVNPTGFSDGTATLGGSAVDLDIVVPTEATSGRTGAFVQISGGRVSTVYGPVSASGVTFVWDTSTIGTLPAHDALAATALIQVFAIEMAYIPQGSFYVGDGTTSTVQGQLRAAGSVTTPFQITSEGQLTLGGGGAGSVGNNNASGMYTADDFNNSTSKTLPAAFPKGYNAFYVMKSEVSQGQWVAFFNTLTTTQKGNRDITGGVLNSTGKASDGEVNRNTVSWTSGTASAGTNTYVACNFLSWMDGAAYAAWAGLRPFTELEYEKMSRGLADPVANEYAWGTTNITQVTGISNSGAANETAGNSGNGLCVYGNHANVQGPLRTGFAGVSGINRLTVGAGYYGGMELSGNVWERPVSVGNATGRGFTGSHGSGELSTNGYATNSDWPGYGSGEVTAATGSGFRGGDWYYATVYARVSDRHYAALVNASRSNTYGARCARTSP